MSLNHHDVERLEDAKVCPFTIMIADASVGTVVAVNGHRIPKIRKIVVEHEAGFSPILRLDLYAGPQEIDAAGEVVFSWAGQSFTLVDVQTARTAGLADLADRLEMAMGQRILEDLKERVG